MLDRLLGLETEYAIAFSPSGPQRPTNEQIFDCYAEVIGTLVDTRPGMRDSEHFLANGGVIHYESPPPAPHDGLVEGGTPECRGPNAVLVYQRAQDLLLARATPIVAGRLREQGYPGTLGLLKNCRDAEGHIYGAQENYELEIARGAWLWVWRFGVAALAPPTLVATIVMWLFVLGVAIASVAVMLAGGLVALCIGTRARAWVRSTLAAPFISGLYRAVCLIERLMWDPVVLLFAGLYRLVAFRHIRRGLVPFLMTRPIFTGAGTLERDRFALSEKGVAARRLFRISLGPERVVFDAGSLTKRLGGLAYLDVRGYRSLFGRRQRLQLGLSDSNMAQYAEYLKVATTCLVIDMAEAGVLDDVPRMPRPIRTLGRVVRDADVSRLALETQRDYVERARRFVREHPVHSIEATELVERWAATLDALEHDRDALIGRLDWVTKRHLVETAAPSPLGAAARKKIDLKYHELATGYFARFEDAGLAPILVTVDEAAAAWTTPPADSPARARARAMGELTGKLRVTWDRVRVGGPVRGKVIRLDDYR